MEKRVLTEVQNTAHYSLNLSERKKTPPVYYAESVKERELKQKIANLEDHIVILNEELTYLRDFILNNLAHKSRRHR